MFFLVACVDPTDSKPSTEETGTDTETSAPVLCDDGLPGRAWDPGGDGAGFGSVAAEIDSPTTSGEDFVLSQLWTGCDSFVFVGVDDNDGYLSTLLDDKLKNMLRDGPENVHYLLAADGGGDDTRAALDELVTDTVDGSLADWADRVHVMQKNAGLVEDWIGDLGQQIGWNVFGIDRFQKLREVGYLVDVTTSSSSAEWEFLSYEVDLYNFEAAREVELEAQGATVIPVLEATLVEDSAWAGVTTKAEVELPDAATMAGFDSMQLDLSLSCGGNWYEACPAWDYLAYVYLCDNDDPGTSDVDESTTCTEMSRFITAYWRGGRWVMDASAFLAELRDGGTHTLRVYSTQPYYVDLSIRLFDAGTGSRPQSMEYLWSGGSFDETYNDAHTAIEFTPPAGTTRVRLVTTITGHGFGSNQENCAEFCNHQHEFTVNGGSPVLQEFPEAGDNEGCIDQVATKGVSPNQAGTWPYGRGGWCPGLGIDPWVVDITADVDLGGTNTISYRGLFEGEPYVPTVIDYNFPARIDMTSWLVYEQ